MHHHLLHVGILKIAKLPSSVLATANQDTSQGARRKRIDAPLPRVGHYSHQRGNSCSRVDTVNEVPSARPSFAWKGSSARGCLVAAWRAYCLHFTKWALWPNSSKSSLYTREGQQAMVRQWLNVSTNGSRASTSSASRSSMLCSPASCRRKVRRINDVSVMFAVQTG